MAVTPTNEQAARWAEMVLGSSDKFSLSTAISVERDLRSGTYRWTADPVIDQRGEWFDSAEAGTPHSFGVHAFRKIVTPLLRRGAVIIIESPIALPERDRRDVVSQHEGIRLMFKERRDSPAEERFETFVALDSGATPESISLAHGIAGGFWHEVGVATTTPVSTLPSDGTDVSDDRLPEWARSATHVFFRGPSYDGYVVWTAPGADPPEL